MPESYKIKLKDRKEIARETMAFYFEKPKDFIFVAGQHITMKQTGIDDNSRVFCMASAPYEDDLIFAMRMRDSEFKNALKSMPIGAEVEITKPRGSFILHDDMSRPAVFLVGGIGVTPFRSMLLQVAHEKLTHKIFMFYSNYTLLDAAFLDELKDLENKNSSYKFIATMTKAEWHGETGYISKDMLKKYIDDIKALIYYIAGPPGFVLAMRGLIEEIGVNPDDIKTDEFEGY